MNKSFFRSVVVVTAASLLTGMSWVALAEDAPSCTALSSLDSPECAHLQTLIEAIQGQSVVSYRGIATDSNSLSEASMACGYAADAPRLPQKFSNLQSVTEAINTLTERCSGEDFVNAVGVTALVLNSSDYDFEAVVELSNGAQISVLETVPLYTTELMLEAESESEYFLLDVDP